MNNYLIEAIAILALANIVTRAFPFIVFAKAKPNRWIDYIEKSFPLVILIILIFYTLISSDFKNSPFAYKEIIAIASAVVLHLLKSNYLLSIFGSTLIYMALVQMV